MEVLRSFMAFFQSATGDRRHAARSQDTYRIICKKHLLLELRFIQ